MSQLGTTTIFRGDDSHFRGTLRGMESSAQDSFGRLAKSYKSEFAGVLQAKGTVTALAGLVTGAFAGFGVGAALQPVVSAFEALAGKSREMFEYARKEAAVREKSGRAAFDAATALLKIASGGSSPTRERFDDIERLRDEFVSQAINNIGKVGKGFSPQMIEAHYEKVKAAMAEGEAMASAAAAAVWAEAAAKADTLATEQEIARLRAEGNVLAADSLAETERHFRAVAEAQKVLENGDASRHAKLMDAEARRHEAEKGRITREQQARDDAARRQAEQAEAQAAREKERAQTMALENALALDMQEVERLKLAGQEDAARALQAQVEHRRTLRAIETAEGLSDAQRAERADNETRNFGLRMAALGRNDGGRGLAAPAGLLSFTALRAAIGGEKTVQSVIAEESKKQQRFLEAIEELLRMINNKRPIDMAFRLT